MLQHWQRWNSLLPEFESYIVTAYEMLKRSDAEQAEFFSDLASWKEKYGLLSDTVAFLMATSDQNIGQELKERMDIIINNWEQLFGYVEKYLHSGEISRSRKEYQAGLEELDISSIYLTHIDRDAFQPLSGLVSLTCTQCWSLEAVEPDLWSPLTALEYLDLSYSPHSIIPTE